MPNIVSGILSAAFISVALVLGEFVFASLLHYDTMPVALAAIYKYDASVGRRRRVRLDRARSRCCCSGLSFFNRNKATDVGGHNA